MGSDHAPLVIFATTERATLAALEVAKSLTDPSDPRVTILVPRIVPYGEPLESGGGRDEALDASFRNLASRVGMRASVRVCVCRDPCHISGRYQLPPSRIVVGGRWGGWHATPEQQLASALAADGHAVTFVDADAGVAHPMSSQDVRVSAET